MIQSMDPEQALRILIGIRVTYRLGRAYIEEENRNRADVDINSQIARLTDSDIKDGGVEWNGLFKKRPDISDRGRGDVYEIRPDNPAAINKGYTDVLTYIDILNQRHSSINFFPGTWQPRESFYILEGIPGINSLKPLKISARNAGGGVIAYRIDDKDIRERVLDLLKILAITGMLSMRVQVSQGITAAQVMNISQMAAKRAMQVSTIETARLKGHKNIAMTNAMMGVF